MNDNPLRMLPQIDKWLQHSSMQELLAHYPREWIIAAMQHCLGLVRAGLLSGELKTFSLESLELDVIQWLKKRSEPSLRRVVNATGVVVHTNLGRTPLADEAALSAACMAKHYNTLEYDLASGRRGSRDSHTAPLLCELTGAEDAFIVNNNAAAVLLVLDTLAKGKKVIVSRGELVEIGGGFRVPEVMAHSGAKLTEVGTTNRTRTDDYAGAIDEQTAALMVVHRSNFRIIGFTHSPEHRDLTALAKSRGIFSLYDYGGGLLEQSLGFAQEQTVSQAFAAGFDIVTFSGDKLLGGPQCGIIAGKKEIVAQLRKNPLTRALRVDKMITAALEATLSIYLRHEQLEKIPVLKMLSAGPEVLQARAERLAAGLQAVCSDVRCAIRVVESDSRVGGGAMPEHPFASYAVVVGVEGISPAQLAGRLRERADIPVIARISEGMLVFDMRTLAEDELEIVLAAVKKALEGFNC